MSFSYFVVIPMIPSKFKQILQYWMGSWVICTFFSKFVLTSQFMTLWVWYKILRSWHILSYRCLGIIWSNLGDAKCQSLIYKFLLFWLFSLIGNKLNFGLRYPIKDGNLVLILLMSLVSCSCLDILAFTYMQYISNPISFLVLPLRKCGTLYWLGCGAVYN